MTEDTDEGTLITCDFCSTAILLHDRIGHKVRTHLKKKGWSIYIDNREWIHECPLCVKTRFATGNEQVQQQLQKA